MHSCIGNCSTPCQSRGRRVSGYILQLSCWDQEQSLIVQECLHVVAVTVLVGCLIVLVGVLDVVLVGFAFEFVFVAQLSVA